MSDDSYPEENLFMAGLPEPILEPTPEPKDEDGEK